jgi:hypothetical protein
MTTATLGTQIIIQNSKMSGKSHRKEILKKIDARLRKQLREETERMIYDQKPWWKRLFTKTPVAPEDTPFEAIVAEEILETYLLSNKRTLRVSDYAQYFMSLTDALDAFLEMGCRRKRPNDNNLLLLPWVDGN